MHIRVLQMVHFPTVPKLLLVFTICILRNSCKRCAIITALFTMAGFVAMEVDCLWVIFGVCGTQITFTRPKGVAVSNQNEFKTPCMHTLSTAFTKNVVAIISSP